MEGITPRATLPNPELVKSAREAALGSAIACGIEVEDAVDLDAIENVRSIVRTIWGLEIVPPRNFLKAITPAAITKQSVLESELWDGTMDCIFTPIKSVSWPRNGVPVSDSP